jgi:hypothetical protein
MNVLPTFAGWKPVFGLGVAHAQTVEGDILPALVFTEDTSAILLPPLPQGGELSGTLLGALGEQLQLNWGAAVSVGSAPAASLCWLADSAGGHPVSLRLSASTVPRRLYFQLPPGHSPVLTRLQLQDQSTSP